jgi:hypothetical protein
MGLEKSLTGLLAIELVFVLAGISPYFPILKFITAFAVGIALTAKDHSWVDNLSTVDPTLSPYVATPDILTYNVSIVKSSSA